MRPIITAADATSTSSFVQLRRVYSTRLGQVHKKRTFVDQWSKMSYTSDAICIAETTVSKHWCQTVKNYMLHAAHL